MQLDQSHGSQQVELASGGKSWGWSTQLEQAGLWVIWPTGPLSGSESPARQLARRFCVVVMGLRDPWLRFCHAGTWGKPRAWPLVRISRNWMSGLGLVTPGKPMLGQAGNEPLLSWRWHLLAWAGLEKAFHSGF